MSPVNTVARAGRVVNGHEIRTDGTPRNHAVPVKQRGVVKRGDPSGTQSLGRLKDNDPIDQPGGQEGPGDGRATLEEERPNIMPGKGLQPGPNGPAVQHLDPRREQCELTPRVAGGGHHDGRHEGGCRGQV
jgi:hypothetical protein